MNEQLQKALAVLAERLGTTAEHLWQVLIHQARVELITDFLSVLGAFVLIAVVTKYWLWVRKACDTLPYTAEFFVLFLGVAGSIVAAIFTVAGILALFEIPTLLFNPEYWALSQIRELIK